MIHKRWKHRANAALKTRKTGESRESWLTLLEQRFMSRNLHGTIPKAAKAELQLKNCYILNVNKFLEIKTSRGLREEPPHSVRFTSRSSIDSHNKYWRKIRSYFWQRKERRKYFERQWSILFSLTRLVLRWN